MKKILFLSAILSLILPLEAASIQNEMPSYISKGSLRIRSDKFANWTELGETITFKPEKPLPGQGTVSVTLKTGEDGIFLQKDIPLKEFNEKGWSWKADEAGFYNVIFALNGKPHAESWICNVWKFDHKLDRFIKRASVDIARTEHSMVVTDGLARPPKEISRQFSMCADFYPWTFKLMRKVGVSGLRASGLCWYKIQPERGKFDWKEMDDWVGLAEKYGYQQKDMLFTPLDIPRWASSKPDDNRYLIGRRAWASMAPADFRDWQNFLTALLKRYPGIRQLELWNEPHLPGFSVFWQDTPEKHVELMRTGYEAVKKVNPEITVLWAGISARYIPFYERILALGGAKYFDKLTLHGTWQNYGVFSAMEKKAGFAPKPKGNTEWHAHLIKPWQSFYPNERQGARIILMGFLSMIRQNVEPIYFFSMFNNGGCELEELAINHKYGRGDPCVPGLFRMIPYTQPRYIAAAYHVLSRLTKGNLHVLSGWNFGKCQGQLTESENGPMFFLWDAGADPVPLPDDIYEAVKGGKMYGADGRPCKLKRGMQILPDAYYIFTGIRKEPFAKFASKQANVLVQYEPERPLQYLYRGTYRPGPLFNDKMEILAPEKLHFMQAAKEIQLVRNAETGRVQGKFACGLSEKGLDILAYVKDEEHFVIHKTPGFWEGDSLQFAVDCGGKGRSCDMLELGVTGIPGKDARAWKTLSPAMEGDLPSEYTMGQGELRYCKTKVTRKNGVTEYRVHIAPGELYPFIYRRGSTLRFSFLVNHHDGKARSTILEWGSGIGSGGKDPLKYGSLTEEVPENGGLTQKDLGLRFPNPRFKVSTLPDGTVRVESKDAPQAVISTAGKPAPGGGVYHLEFDARGDADLIVMVTGKGFKRVDPLKRSQRLSGEWKHFKAILELPADAESYAMSFFCWNQPGKWFEIRNFRCSGQSSSR